MSRDFRSQQIQTRQLIASGTLGDGSGAKIVVYPIEAEDSGTPNQGVINQNAFNTGSLNGRDIFLFVSGAVGGKDGAGRDIAVFGGDLHVSGNLSVSGEGAGGIPTKISNSLGDVELTTDRTGTGTNKRIYATLETKEVLGIHSGSMSASFIDSAGLTSSFGMGENGVNNLIDGAYLAHGDPFLSDQYAAVYAYVNNPGSTSNVIVSTLAGNPFGNRATFFADKNRGAVGGEQLRAGPEVTVSGAQATARLEWQGGIHRYVVGGVDHILLSGSVGTRITGTLEVSRTATFLSGADFDGKIEYNPTLATTVVTMSSDSNFYSFDSSGGAFTAVMPSDVQSGHTVIVKDITGNAASNNITLSSSTTAQIDGSSTYTMAINYAAVTLTYVSHSSTGDTWSII